MNELQRINQQMGYIADLARTYANATPEQRARVNIEDIWAQLNRYNELKDRKQQLLAEQEDRWSKELEAGRQANQQQVNTRGTGRRANPKTNEGLSNPTQTIYGQASFTGTDGNTYSIQPGQQVTDANGNTMFWDQFNNQLQWIKLTPKQFNDGRLETNGGTSPVPDVTLNTENITPVNNTLLGGTYNPNRQLTIGGKPIGSFRGNNRNIVELNNNSIVPGRNNYGLVNPGSLIIDRNGNFRTLGTGGNVQTTYANGLKSTNPGSFVINGNGAQVIDSNGNLVRWNNLLPGGYL